MTRRLLWFVCKPNRIVYRGFVGIPMVCVDVTAQLEEIAGIIALLRGFL